MSLKITGKIRIFSKEFNGVPAYSTTISRKTEEGNYENLYVAVSFRKGQETDGDIIVNDGFITWFKNNTGLQKIKLVVLDYDKENEWISTDDMPDLPF